MFYYREDAESPTVQGNLIFMTGSLFEPKGKEGLANLALTMLKSGGTKSLTPDKLEERLDFLGSTISVGASDEYSSIGFWTLKKNFAETWKIVVDMLFNPAFDAGRFETEKQMQIEEIRRRWDQPMMIGMAIYNDLLYGKDYPDARRTTSASINAITLDDIRAFYQSQVRDRAFTAAMAGDFEAKKVSALIASSFKPWAAKPADKPAVPKAALASKPGIYLVDKPDMTQAIICMGHMGINRLDPDNVEIGVMNFILGTGSFNSRIMREVRSNRGLAYSAFGSVGAGRDLGIFFNFTQTKSQSVGEAITLIRDIIADMAKNPVSEGELGTAKKYEQNAFVHRFDSSMSVLQQALQAKMQGFPDDYLETYIPRIKKVDAAKVLALAKRTMHPDQLIILVVGRKSELLDQLKALNMGEVKELPLPKQ